MTRKILIIFISILLFSNTAYAIKTPAPAIFNKPSLESDSVNDYSQISYKKYPLKLGIAPIRDVRVMPFYHSKDDFFKENITDALQKNLLNEIRASGIFDEVKLIDANDVFPFNKDKNLALQEKYNIDAILLIDLNNFNMIRGMTEDEMKNISSTVNYREITSGMEITVELDILAQLVYLKSNYLIWTDEIDKKNVEFASKGALNKQQTGEIARSTIQQGIEEVIKLLLLNGKEMKVNNV